MAVQRFFDAIAFEADWLGKAGQGTRIGLLLNTWIGIQIENIAEVATLAQAAAGPARSRLPILNHIAITWAEAVRDFGEADISALYLAFQRR